MKVKGNTIFALILLTVLLMFVSLAFTYSSEARIVPLIIGALALGLICLQLLVEIIPELSQKVGILGEEEKEIFGSKQLVKKIEAEPGKETVSSSNKSIKIGEIQGFLWLLALVCLIFLVGYLIAIPVFLFLFFKLLASRGWTFSIAVAGITWVVVYFSFIMLLNIPLYKGVVFALVHIR